jgi:hypothetical protein
MELQVHRRVQKSPPLDPILSQLYRLHTATFILVFSSHLHLDLPSSLFPWGFATENLYVFLVSPMLANVTPMSSYQI